MNKKETLQRRITRQETAPEKERERLRKACAEIPWGAEMRRGRCAPSFHKEEELTGKTQEIKSRLSEPD
mgnify:CR=1 FL=1